MNKKLEFSMLPTSIKGNYLSIKKYGDELLLNTHFNRACKSAAFKIKIKEDTKLLLEVGSLKVEDESLGLDFCVAFYGNDSAVIKTYKPLTLTHVPVERGYNACNAYCHRDIIRICDSGMDRYIWLSKK